MRKTLLVIRRSNTSGASWGAPEVHPELSASPGARNNRTDQEWSVHVLQDATVLLNDGSCSMFRSTDLGRTFRAVQGDGGDPFHFNSTDECGSWSVLELTEPDKGMPAGSFYFLDDSIWTSTNSGAYWQPFQTVHNRGELSAPMRNFPYAPWSPFAKSKPLGGNGGFFFQSEVYRRTDGRFLHGARTPVAPGCDDYDGSQLWRSVDTRGKEWACASAAAGGFCDDRNHTCLALQHGYTDLCNHSQSNRGLFLPGSVYSHFLRLHDGRLLLSWTHRTPKYDQDGYGGGTRALLSYDDGDTFDAAHDYIVLSAQNDSLNAFCLSGCGCHDGYGNTIQLPNGTLVSVYCHDGPAEASPALRFAVVGVVRWELPPPPLKTDESGARPDSASPGSLAFVPLSRACGEFDF